MSALNKCLCWGNVQLQSLFIGILGSKGTLGTALSHSGAGGWVSWVLPGHAMGLCVLLGAVAMAVGIMRFAKHCSNCLAEGFMLWHKHGTLPFPLMGKQIPPSTSYLYHPGNCWSSGFSPSVTQVRASCKHLYLNISLQWTLNCLKPDKARLWAKMCTS